MSEQQFRTTSPLPPNSEVKKPAVYLFSDALKFALEGESITREEWDNPEFYCVLRHSEAYNTKVLAIHKSDGKFYDWVISVSDLLADDWIVLPKGN